MKNMLLSLLAFCVSVVFADDMLGFAQKEPIPVREIERTASVYHSYEFDSIVDTPPPEGYKPFYLSRYGRHGSRRLTGRYVSSTLETLEKAYTQGRLTQTGKELLADIRRINEATDGMVGELSERGAEEQRCLAKRMVERFPEVFSGDRRVRCYSSVFSRVLLSQANFTMTLKDCSKDLSFRFATGQRYQRLVNGLHFARKETKAKPPVAKPANSDALIARIFSTPDPAMDRDKFARNLFVCASGCQCLYRELKGLDIYRYFKSAEITEFSRVLEADLYASMGNSKEYGDVTLAASSGLMSDFINRANAAISDNRIAADLRFGHDSGLWPIAGCFGLIGPGDRVHSSEAAEKCPGWKWMCMAANFQMVLYRNSQNDILVKFLYNEKEMSARNLKPFIGPYYRWNDVVNNYDSLLNR